MQSGPREVWFSLEHRAAPGFFLFSFFKIEALSFSSLPRQRSIQQHLDVAHFFFGISVYICDFLTKKSAGLPLIASFIINISVKAGV